MSSFYSLPPQFPPLTGVSSLHRTPPEPFNGPTETNSPPPLASFPTSVFFFSSLVGHAVRLFSRFVNDRIFQYAFQPSHPLRRIFRGRRYSTSLVALFLSPLSRMITSSSPLLYRADTEMSRFSSHFLFTPSHYRRGHIFVV